MTQRPRLPSIQSLEALLRIAKGANVAEAASQLNLTASAVSRRLQNLEDALGVALLDRSGPRLMLTRAGTAYVESVEPLLYALGNVGHALTAPHDVQLELQVQSTPSFYANLIAPRLWEFLEKWPDAVVSLLTSDTRYRAPDIAIRPSPIDKSIGNERKLLDFFVTPVLRQDLFEKHSIRNPSDIIKIPLIDNLNRPDDWVRWLSRAGVTDIPHERHVFVDSSFTAHAAMIGGSGAALFPSLYSKSIYNRNLVCPFPYLAVYTGSSFISLNSDKPIAESFHDWLMDEVIHSSSS